MLKIFANNKLFFTFGEFNSQEKFNNISI